MTNLLMLVCSGVFLFVMVDAYRNNRRLSAQFADAVRVMRRPFDDYVEAHALENVRRQLDGE